MSIFKQHRPKPCKFLYSWRFYAKHGEWSFETFFELFQRLCQGFELISPKMWIHSVRSCFIWQAITICMFGVLRSTFDIFLSKEIFEKHCSFRSYPAKIVSSGFCYSGFCPCSCRVTFVISVTKCSFQPILDKKLGLIS